MGAKNNTVKIWGTLTNDAYSDVDNLPPHEVEIEIDLSYLDKQIKKQLLTYPSQKYVQAKRTANDNNQATQK
jgi:hypothetical protein